MGVRYEQLEGAVEKTIGEFRMSSFSSASGEGGLT